MLNLKVKTCTQKNIIYAYENFIYESTVIPQYDGTHNVQHVHQI